MQSLAITVIRLLVAAKPRYVVLDSKSLCTTVESYDHYDSVDHTESKLYIGITVNANKK